MMGKGWGRSDEGSHEPKACHTKMLPVARAEP